VKKGDETAKTFCIAAFFRPRGLGLGFFGGLRLTRGSSVRGGYVLRWVRIVLNSFCVYSID
jgi:hypothetical protein